MYACVRVSLSTGRAGRISFKADIQGDFAGVNHRRAGRWYLNIPRGSRGNFSVFLGSAFRVGVWNGCGMFAEKTQVAHEFRLKFIVNKLTICSQVDVEKWRDPW